MEAQQICLPSAQGVQRLMWIVYHAMISTVCAVHPHPAWTCSHPVLHPFRLLSSQGLARKLLSICEELCAARGLRRLYLHARLGDEPALQLYKSGAYQTEAQDSFLVKLRGITPRALMFKELTGVGTTEPEQGSPS